MLVIIIIIIIISLREVEKEHLKWNQGPDKKRVIHPEQTGQTNKPSSEPKKSFVWKQKPLKGLNDLENAKKSSL